MYIKDKMTFIFRWSKSSLYTSFWEIYFTKESAWCPRDFGMRFG